MYEVRGLKEWGFIGDYWQYLALPEPVKNAWRMCAVAENEALSPAGT